MKKKKTAVIKEKEKRQVWEPIYKKYKANKSTRIHVTKEHNNQDITNTLIK
jgi:hypothetical protein